MVAIEIGGGVVPGPFGKRQKVSEKLTLRLKVVAGPGDSKSFLAISLFLMII